MFIMQDYHFGKLPCWVDGNAYFNGAKSWKNEGNKYMGPDGAYVELVEEDGKYFIKTNIYELLGDWTTAIIDSDVLGEAFEPEQRFENPDGSTIVFNRDYFGNERHLTAVPGPFADGNAAAGILA